MSTVVSDFDGESTRKLSEDIARVTGPRLKSTLDAAHRKWPEHYGPSRARADARDGKDNGRKLGASQNLSDDSTQDPWKGSKWTRAEMQPSVDTADASSILGQSPIGPLPGTRTNTRKPRSPLHTYTASPPVPTSRPYNPTNLQDVLDSLQQPGGNSRTKSHRLSSHGPGSFSHIAAPPSPAASSPGQNATSRSFVMPDISHLGDFVSGSLKFTGSMKNGVPVFVKNGRVYDRSARQPPNDHAEIDGLEIPDDEERIFVSMDMIRKEIISLQEHDEMVQNYADGLQRQVDRLESEVQQMRLGRSNDSGLGSSTGSDHAAERWAVEKTKMESQIVTLQTRLEETVRRVSVAETQNSGLSAEKDRATRKLQDASEEVADLMDRLETTEKELEAARRQIDASRQTAATDSDSTRQEVAALKASHETLRAENQSLRADNGTLRRDHDSLMSENQSLRSSNRTLMKEAEDLRHDLDVAQQELEVAKDDVDQLHNEIQTLEQQYSELKEDNESLIRNNEKFFNENRNLRRENSGFERTLHDINDENVQLKEEVEFLKQQLDHCRPIGRDIDLSAALDEEETDENMTSAFLVPDLTIQSNDQSAPVEQTAQSDQAPPSELATRSTRLDGTEQVSRTTRRGQTTKSSKREVTSRGGNSSQKVAFSLPRAKGETQEKQQPNVANKGSKRRVPSSSAARGIRGDLATETDVLDDSFSRPLSIDNTQTQAKAVATARSRGEGAKTQRAAREVTQQRTANITSKSQRKTVDYTADSLQDTQQNCPALSPSARRVLDNLCDHKCDNCSVCSRIASHRRTVSASDLASGKKRIAVQKPVPVSDRAPDPDIEDPTIRPASSPGDALGYVIKVVQDEIAHLEMEIQNKQAQVLRCDGAVAKRQRYDLSRELQELMDSVNAKKDLKYKLFDVLEGQKAASQVMTYDEVEMTVFDLTGLGLQRFIDQVTVEQM